MDTDARIIAIRYYGGSERRMGEDLAALSDNPEAVIIYMPQLVVLMKPADSKAPGEWERLRETPAGADAWYIHLLAGNLELARKLAQQQQARPWLCFLRGQRNARPHIMNWQRFTTPRPTYNKTHRKNNSPWDL